MSRFYNTRVILLCILIVFQGGSAFSNTHIRFPFRFLDRPSVQVTSSEKWIHLSWKMYPAKGLSHLIVERSVEGQPFTVAGILLDGMKDGAQIGYRFKDQRTALFGKQNIVYRIKEVYHNGDIRTGETIPVTVPNI